jgi:hypothetical protein
MYNITKGAARLGFQINLLAMIAVGCIAYNIAAKIPVALLK